LWGARAGATLVAMSEDPEERVLMPQPAPRPGRSREERELASLRAQLGALDRDIAAARQAAVPPPLRLRGHEEGAPPPHGERVRLRDGAEILVRPVQPQDAALLKAGFEHLSAVSRYQRFLAPIDHLSPRQLAYLTHVDHTSHEALAALDSVTGEGIGIARYVCDRDDKRQAEVAIIVTDAWRGRGVGTALCQRLIARARTAGVQRIRARMLVGNHAARRLVTHFADAQSEQRDPGTVLLTARLRS
jgi:RimJ/RimL family protein N-acetyltransferase